jgi:hypothetical protein
LAVLAFNSLADGPRRLGECQVDGHHRGATELLRQRLQAISSPRD